MYNYIEEKCTYFVKRKGYKLSIKIIANGIYLPEKKISSEELEKKINLEKGYIEKRTGISQRYYIQDETIEEMALKAVENLQRKKSIEDVQLIIVATTSSNNLMPGISNYIQKHMNLKSCICLDVLAGCSGYINAFDIAKMYIETNKIKKALIVGVDLLSKLTDLKDIGTSIILSDGAGATLIEKTDEGKKYYSYIVSEGENNQILTYKSNEKICMDGKAIYKYAVTQPVLNVLELINQSKENLEDIKYIVPHQSNIKIIKSIASKLKIDNQKVYTNMQSIGNTFCASIPIALNEMYEKKLLKSGDKIILLGYGGGLNTGSILLEV